MKSVRPLLVALTLTLASAGRAQAPRDPAPGQAWLDPVSGIEFVYCPPGTFAMGSPDQGPRTVKDQTPQHQVTISKGFWLGRTEVTQAAWTKWMKGNPSKFKGDDRPVDTVRWNDAQVFLGKLNAAAKANLYRLPTEAEWEYACRAGAPEPTELPKVAWFDKSPLVGTNPVAQLQPNAWGLYDMLGNVREWCSDWRGPYAAEPATDPKGAPKGTYRINRGSGYYSRAEYMTSTYRWHYTPDFADDDVGFRVLRVQ